MKMTQRLGRHLTAFALISLTVLPAWAQSVKEVVDLDQLASGGSGCPGGDPLEVYQSDFSGRVMVFLPALKVDVTRKSIDRKACAISLPVSLPSNKRLVIAQPAIFGSAQLADGASAVARAEIFEAGSQGPSVEENLTGVDDTQEFFYQRGEVEVRTACGAQLNLRANVSLLGKKGRASAGGTAELEGVAMTLQIEDCDVDSGTIEIAE